MKVTFVKYRSQTTKSWLPVEAEGMYINGKVVAESDADIWKDGPNPSKPIRGTIPGTEVVNAIKLFQQDWVDVELPDGEIDVIEQREATTQEMADFVESGCVARVLT